MNLGERLATVRKQKGFSQKDLAVMLFVSVNTISGWETGRTKPKIEMLGKLCGILDCSLDYLILGNQNRIITDDKYLVFLKSIDENRKVWLVYNSQSEGLVQRIICPKKLLYVHNQLYCAAFCELRKEMRLFSFERIKECRLLEDRFDV